MHETSIRALVGALIGAVAVAACGGSAPVGSPAQPLAPLGAQVLRFGVAQPALNLDPARTHDPTTVSLVQNLFDGLYRWDEHLRIVPDAALGMPDVSPDGLTYTFHLNPAVRFSNGDPVTAQDWIWSWTRALRIHAADLSALELIQGAAEVEQGRASTVTGLSAPGDLTLVARLVRPAGYWLGQLAIPGPASVVDPRVLTASGDPDGSAWATSPATCVGTGPYRLAGVRPGRSLWFTPLADWWGGSSGVLQKVVVDLGVAPSTQVRRFEDGAYDLVGEASQPIDPADLVRYAEQPNLRQQLHQEPTATTVALAFDPESGPFAGGTEPAAVSAGTTPAPAEDRGPIAREAFDLAIDRQQLANAACAGSLTCVPATGGPIPPTLRGYLGTGKDPYAHADPARARRLLAEAGGPARFDGLVLAYPPDDRSARVAHELVAQWRSALGVEVTAAAVAPGAVQARPVLFLETWTAPYDSPQAWFDAHPSCTAVPLAGIGSACPASVTRLVGRAAVTAGDGALPLYQQALQVVVRDVTWAALLYGQQPVLIQPYLLGWDYSGLEDVPWTDLKFIAR
ncbi:MAG TPA: ABC transporter substrate-binding protein [Candidatus Dormibacteraeota bacterium]|nr:ABC transporter substrate-binding protein [Candidatus Dormibacteraeota bacterium]